MNSTDNSIINVDDLRLMCKDYLESIGKWVDNVNLTTPSTITTPNTILTPIESLASTSNIASSSSLSPILQNIVTTTVEQYSNNADQINTVINLFSG
jgi:hypothetical protein